MRKLDAIPEGIIEDIRSEHERALAKMGNSKSRYASVPARPVQMRIDRPNSHDMTIEDVIVPGVWIYAPESAFLEDEMLMTSQLSFHLPMTQDAYPLAHVFYSSGTICLGNIPVPRTISRYSPLTPLDTLFIYNDHHTAHGNAHATVTPGEHKQIIQLLQKERIGITQDVRDTFLANINLIDNDAVWILSADVLKSKRDLQKAMPIMEKIFAIIFGNIDKNL